VLGGELAAADDGAAAGDAGLLAGDAGLLGAVALSAAGVDGLFDVDAATAMMTMAPKAIKPVSTLCRAIHGFRVGGCGGWYPGCGPQGGGCL
jgi:hypothetical protein